MGKEVLLTPGWEKHTLIFAFVHRAIFTEMLHEAAQVHRILMQLLVDM